MFDHFRAVVNAIAAKAQQGKARSTGDDVVGGATLSFDIHDDHPFRDRVERLLKDVRRDVDALWRDVEAYNADHRVDSAAMRRVFFYFGQYVQESERESGGGGVE